MSKIIKVHIEKAGLHSSIQDLGRPGYQAMGIPLGGVLDSEAAYLANKLVGNAPDTPLIEITLLGPRLYFEGEAQIALTGADLSARLNDKAINSYKTIYLRGENRLKFGRPNSGCRAYLAIGGEWQVKKWLGSASLATQDWQKLTPDSKLEKGKTLKIKVGNFMEPRSFSFEAPSSVEVEKIEVLPGPDFYSFNHLQIAQFFSTEFKISTDSNRMGYRLEPALPDYQQNLSLISSGILPGTVQISNAGNPIVLLADAHTVGGYPRIVVLTKKGKNKIAQLKPGDQFRFVLKES